MLVLCSFLILMQNLRGCSDHRGKESAQVNKLRSTECNGLKAFQQCCDGHGSGSAFQFKVLTGMQSHSALLSALSTRFSVRESRLKAVFFRSCSALCMNSNAWQSTQGRLSAGMTVPVSWSAEICPKQSSWTVSSSSIITAAVNDLILKPCGLEITTTPRMRPVQSIKPVMPAKFAG